MEARASIYRHVIVSFVVPVLNGAAYIARCLRSLQGIHYPGFLYEIIVIDNGSTDGTIDIVREMGINVQSVPDVNVSTVRNCGVSIARGDFLAFVDADVEVKACWVENGLATFNSPQVVAAGCFPVIPDPSTWVQRAWDVHQRRSHRDGERVQWLPSMNLLVRREVFLSVGGFNETLETAEDVDLCYRLGSQGVIVWNSGMEAIHWGSEGFTYVLAERGMAWDR